MKDINPNKSINPDISLEKEGELLSADENKPITIHTVPTFIELMRQNKVLNNFIYLAFLNERMQTGGSIGYDIEAWHKNLGYLKEIGMSVETIKGLINNLNKKNPAIGSLTDDEYRFIYQHTDKNYSKVLGEIIGDNGFEFELKLSGDILKDYGLISGFKDILLAKGIGGVTNEYFNAKPCNVWRLIHATYISDNKPTQTVRIAITQRNNIQSSFQLLKCILIIERWYKKRLPEVEPDNFTTRKAPSASAQDSQINQNEFITEQSVVLNPFSNQENNENVFTEHPTFVDDVKENNEVEVLENDTNTGEVETETSGNNDEAPETPNGGQEQENETADGIGTIAGDRLRDAYEEIPDENENKEIEKSTKKQGFFSKIKSKLGFTIKQAETSEVKPPPPKTGKIPLPPTRKDYKALLSSEKKETKAITPVNEYSDSSVMVLEMLWADCTSGVLLRADVNYQPKVGQVDSDGDANQTPTE